MKRRKVQPRPAIVAPSGSEARDSSTSERASLDAPRGGGTPGVECPFCGHNLAGTPTPVCPECGQRWDVHAAFRRYAAAHLSGRIRLRMAASGLFLAAFAGLALLLAGWRLWPPRLAAGTPAWWCFLLTVPAILSCWFAGELIVSAWTARTRPVVFRILDLFEFNPR